MACSPQSFPFSLGNRTAARVEWRYEPGADYIVLADPDGNRFCVVEAEASHAVSSENVLSLPARLDAGNRKEALLVLFRRTPDAGKRFWEFFSVNIRNRNTRKAYFVAVAQFSAWCEGKGISDLALL